MTDSHVHIFPERIAPAVDAIGKFYDRVTVGNSPERRSHMIHAGTAEDLLSVTRDAGFDRYLVFSTATSAHQVEIINRFIARECASHPEFIGAGTMHTEYPDMEAELDRMLGLGLHGVKLHPDMQRFQLDDPRLMPMYAAMQERGMFLVAHTGDYRYHFSEPFRMERIARAFPRLQCIAAHLGGWSQWAEARELLRLPNVYIDTSSTYSFAGPGPLLEAFRSFDPSHIFFGSDYPMWDPSEEMERIRSICPSEEFFNGVVHENFSGFLDRLHL